MIGYTTLGSNDLPRAVAFYDALFSVIGGRKVTDFLGRGQGWGNAKGKPLFGVIKPYDGEPATVGNGTMIALPMADQAQVDALHAKALALGATDDGAPGLRGTSFYGAYFRDLDGHKICAFCMV